MYGSEAVVDACTFHSDYPLVVFDNASMDEVPWDSDYSMAASAVALAVVSAAGKQSVDLEMDYN